jgi:hypothetical protein
MPAGDWGSDARLFPGARCREALLLSNKPEQRGGAVANGTELSVQELCFHESSLRELSIQPSKAVAAVLRVPLFLLLCVIPGLSQKPPTANHGPKYDLQTETKTKGIIDEINVLTVGTRKDFAELIVKSGEDKVHVYVCPKPFQEEMGISFSKGDEITITGSKVKQDTADVILARQLVKGSDTLMFRDDKGNPVWDWRTGK